MKHAQVEKGTKNKENLFYQIKVTDIYNAIPTIENLTNGIAPRSTILMPPLGSQACATKPGN